MNPAGSQQIVTNVWLYEVGNTVFGTMGAGEHIVGSRDGMNLSLDIVSSDLTIVTLRKMESSKSAR